MEPSQIPSEIRDQIVKWVYERSDEVLFKIFPKPDFKYTPVKGGFNKTKCTACGEDVFEHYVHTGDG